MPAALEVDPFGREAIERGLPTPIAGEAPAPIGMAGLLFHDGQKLPAGLLAASAGLGAHPAVLVLMGMALALVATALADGHAGLQQRLGDVGIVLGLAGDDADGGDADVGAVQAEPDALD